MQKLFAVYCLFCSVVVIANNNTHIKGGQHRSRDGKHQLGDSSNEHKKSGDRKRRQHRTISDHVVLDNNLPRSTTSHSFIQDVVNLKKSQNVEEFVFSMNNTRKRLVEAMGGIIFPVNTHAQDYIYNIHNVPFHDMMDVAFIFEKKTEGDLSDEVNPQQVFENWRSAVEGYHIIIIGDNEIIDNLALPDWILPNFEMYSRRSLIKTLMNSDVEGSTPFREVKSLQEQLHHARNGQREARELVGADFLEQIFDFIGLHSFAAWVADRDYLYIVDNDCVPIEPVDEMHYTELMKASVNSGSSSSNNNGEGHSIPPHSTSHRGSLHSVLEKHIANLRTPSAPYYHNTFGDPYFPGNDFPHSYPFQFRGGASTAISHGLFIGDKHYDPITRMVKIPKTSTGATGGDFSSAFHQNIDHTDTIAYGQLFSMSRRNLAVNRQMMGPTLMFFGSSNKLNKNPDTTFHNYHDIITGWILKVVIDECNYGAKSGSPYVFKGAPAEFHRDLSEKILTPNVPNGRIITVDNSDDVKLTNTFKGSNMHLKQELHLNNARRRLAENVEYNNNRLGGYDKQYTLDGRKAAMHGDEKQAEQPAVVITSTNSNSNGDSNSGGSNSSNSGGSNSHSNSSPADRELSGDSINKPTTINHNAQLKQQFLRQKQDNQKILSQSEAVADKQRNEANAHEKQAQNEHYEKIKEITAHQQLLFDIKSNFTFLSDPAIYEFFKGYKLNRTTSTYLTNSDCGGRVLRVECVYTELASQLESSELALKYPYFKLYAAFMKLWVTIWQTRHAFLGTLTPTAVRSSFAPKVDKDVPKCAMITITHNEQQLLPVWIRYHLRHFHPSDIYILDHITEDNSTHPSKIPEGINFMKLEGNKYAMPVLFRSNVIKLYQDRLLRSGYNCVLFSDTDEFIVPNPTVYPGGLKQYLHKFAQDKDQLYLRVTALELGHMSWGNGTKESQEPALDWGKSILAQRSFYAFDRVYNKPLLTKVPLAYRPGFHRLYNYRLDRSVANDPELIMFHVRSLDATFCMGREVEKYNMTKNMEPAELNAGFASHWNEYDRSKKTGELCKYAIGCYLGPLTNTTKLFDNTGVFPMYQLEEYWKNVDI